jgi:hypothetical protein
VVTLGGVEVSFVAGGLPSTFRRNDVTGRAELQVGDEVVTLQSPFRLSTHFDVRTTRAWRRTVGGHEVEIVKLRPRAFGGARRNSFTISVDGVVVAQATGK